MKCPSCGGTMMRTGHAWMCIDSGCMKYVYDADAPFIWCGNGWYQRLFAGVPHEIYVQRLPSADRWGFELVGCWLTPNNEWASETFTMEGRYVTRATLRTQDLIGGRIRE